MRDRGLRRCPQGRSQALNGDRRYGTFDACIFCPRRDVCTATGCVDGYTGEGCTRCDTAVQPPWARQFGDCVRCPEQPWGMYAVVAGAVAGGVTGIYFMSAPIETGNLGQAAELLRRGAQNMACITMHLQVCVHNRTSARSVCIRALWRWH